MTHSYTVHTLCYVCTSLDLPLCHVALALCVCDAGNGVAVSVNDIIIKLVATTLKVSTVHRLCIQHASILEQYTDYSTCVLAIQYLWAQRQPEECC